MNCINTRVDAKKRESLFGDERNYDVVSRDVETTVIEFFYEDPVVLKCTKDCT
jgi:hypothetical protein